VVEVNLRGEEKGLRGKRKGKLSQDISSFTEQTWGLSQVRGLGTKLEESEVAILGKRVDKLGRHDTQYNDTQHNYIQSNDTQQF
jgi:hypothetical protein